MIFVFYAHTSDIIRGVQDTKQNLANLGLGSFENHNHDIQISIKKQTRKNLFVVYLTYLAQKNILEPFDGKIYTKNVDGEKFTLVKTRLQTIGIDIPEKLQMQCLYIAFLMNLKAISDVEIMFKIDQNNDEHLIFMGNEDFKIYNYSTMSGDFLFLPNTCRKLDDFIILKKVSASFNDAECLNKLFPCGVAPAISSHFGTKDMLTRNRRRRAGHQGVDLVTKDKTCMIVSMANGVVEQVTRGYGGGYGNYILINHGGGVQTLYGHLSEIMVKTGDKVSIGDAIGYMGSTGISTNPHLHLEFRLDGKKINPEVVGNGPKELMIEIGKTPQLINAVLRVYLIYISNIYQQMTK